ncbi:hypothetical protein [Actinocorallia libanotica]|uniref:Uncharacterized protein n=1 Tax=Actinocorallia libanotica TaxID=46162 RepID=A0ABP4BTJ6_9ACTN
MRHKIFGILSTAALVSLPGVPAMAAVQSASTNTPGVAPQAQRISIDYTIKVHTGGRKAEVKAVLRRLIVPKRDESLPFKAGFVSNWNVCLHREFKIQFNEVPVSHFLLVSCRTTDSAGTASWNVDTSREDRYMLSAQGASSKTFYAGLNINPRDIHRIPTRP